MKLFVLIFALLTPPAFGQARIQVKPTCLPSVTGVRVQVNTVGVCTQFICPISGSNPAMVWKYTYCGTWAEQSKVASRIETIRKAVDPLKSLQTLGSRIPMYSLDDPLAPQGLPRNFP